MISLSLSLSLSPSLPPFLPYRFRHCCCVPSVLTLLSTFGLFWERYLALAVQFHLYLCKCTTSHSVLYLSMVLQCRTIYCTHLTLHHPCMGIGTMVPVASRAGIDPPSSPTLYFLQTVALHKVKPLPII